MNYLFLFFLLFFIGLLGASAPVNIPCSGDVHDRGLHNLSPPVTSPLGSLSHSLQLGSSSLNQSEHSLDKVSCLWIYPQIKNLFIETILI